ncbi:hypothetical protein [Bacteroides sp. MSB163]|uniref:hypothetical protein n=1 Tax=Bacteroides maternus TaxID=3117552 RepID=UPI00261E70A3|nr:hypothetical protein [uncultured Bacteroides sp.]
MKKHILLGIALASLFTLGACDYNEDNFPGFDEKATITDVRTDTLVLTDAYYGKIASMPKNQGLALSKDPENQTYLTALNQLGKTKMFTDMVAPEDYLPAFVDSLYAYLSDNSKVLVRYNVGKEQPEYLSKINEAENFDLTSANYATVWGESMVVKYLTPSTLKKIPALLKEGVKSPKEGDVRQVNYAWSETEPSTGGGELPETIDKISDALAEAGDYKVQGTVIATYARGFLLSDDSGQILVYLNVKPNYTVGDIVTVEGTTSKYANVMQFGNTSVVTRSGRADSFSYPEPKEYTGAQLDAYVGKVDGFHYAKIVGELIIDGNYINLNVAGATKQGAISYPFDGVVDKSLHGKQVEVIGYLIGATSRYNVMATSVEPVDAASTFSPVGEVALAKPGEYAVKGQVIAKYQRGFLLSDGSGTILVFDKNGFDFVPGDIVKVSGAVTNYAGFNQFGTTPVCEKLADGTAKAPTALSLDATAMEEYLTAPFIAYVEYTGKLSVSGTYYNVIISGTDKCQGSIQYPIDGVVDESLNGKQVTVEGYTLGVSGGKYINTMAVKVSEATTTKAISRAVTRASDVKPNAAALYRYDGSAWTVYEESASIGISVMQPADYVATGSDYLSNADAVLPIYLKNAFPYAQSGDTKAVAYFGNKDYAVMADEYGFDGTAWVKKNTETETAEMAFLKTSGSWAEAKEYYSNDFAGVVHNGAHKVNVKLDDMDYVWSDGAGYTRIKASGYYQRNRDTEAWLVTGEIDLTEAIAPQVVFMASADYLYGGKIENAVSVHVSDNYIPADSEKMDEIVAALQAATWSEPLSFEWPTSSKEIEMHSSMADYVGKKVYVAFRYVSTNEPGFAPTFYMSNFVVKE